VRHVLTGEERAALARVRTALERSAGVLVDPAHELAVRAYRLDSRGRRRALGREQVEAALTHAGGTPVRAISGQAQTDLMVERVTKATGLAALAAALGLPTAEPGWLAMAVGDTAADLPMLALAERAYAPANPELRDGAVEVLGRPYQAGLALAAARLLGHRPGRCPVCRMPGLPARSRLLLAALGTPHDGSPAAKSAWAARTMAALAWRLRAAG